MRAYRQLDTAAGTAAGHARVRMSEGPAAVARRARRLRAWAAFGVLAAVFVYGVAANTPKAVANYYLERDKREKEQQKEPT